jgi:hypothetical protein
MNFRTEIRIPASSIKIEHNHTILTIGSCFAENIAEKFKYFLFNVFENPFGVLYNPVSVYNAIKSAVEPKTFTEADLFLDNDEWHSFYHHSDFSSRDSAECLNRINTRNREVKNYLANCSWVIISMGTSFVYRHKEKNIIVSNCHKIPAAQFERILLAPEESEKILMQLTSLLKSVNPDIGIIFTVSPVRHIKDGFAENQLSKSSLIVALHNILSKTNNTFYFPAYEIMMDDLRDYRFYDNDLLHPSRMAVEYIWNKFSECWFSDECISTIKEIEPYVRSKGHVVRNPNSAQGIRFLEEQALRKAKLQEKYPYIILRD